MPMVTLSDVDPCHVQPGEGPDVGWIPGGDRCGIDFAEPFGAFSGFPRRHIRSTGGRGDARSCSPALDHEAVRARLRARERMGDEIRETPIGYL